MACDNMSKNVYDGTCLKAGAKRAGKCCKVHLSKLNCHSESCSYACNFFVNSSTSNFAVLSFQKYCFIMLMLTQLVAIFERVGGHF